MKALILAGGSGTRLWPLSRKAFPKQFLKIHDDKNSLLQQTAKRLLNILAPEDIIVMTNDDYKFHVKSDLNSVLNGNDRSKRLNIILEPSSRNTAPAIALGVKYCIEKLHCKDNETLFISPSDHVIEPPDEFGKYVAMADEIAQKGYIVTFGIKPERPETGYGYIKYVDRDSKNGYYEVDKFTEKPDMETAKRYISNGNYLWNSGMFAFNIETIKKELIKHAPQISEVLNMDLDSVMNNFNKFPDISFDYAVLEKSDRVVTLPLDIYWNDIGSWDSLSEILDKDEQGNVKKGNVVTEDTRRTMVIGGKRLITTIGLEDCLIVETEDAVLISKRGETQKVKDIVKKLKTQNAQEADEHVTTYRPWGSYTVLDEGDRYKIKRIVVKSGAKLSLQKHKFRSEHWVVVNGAAKVTIGDNELLIDENESVYVPKLTLHRLENPGKLPLEIIEVQNGEYVGEDDIERFDDIYGREQ